VFLSFVGTSLENMPIDMIEGPVGFRSKKFLAFTLERVFNVDCVYKVWLGGKTEKGF
jgi:hypothetical protein